MKNPIICIIVLLSITIPSYAQWSPIAQVENDNLYQLLKISDDKVVATGEKTTIYNVSGANPSQPESKLFPFGFITSSLMINQQNSYIGGGCYYAFDDCPANTLHLTKDSGESWEPVLSDFTFTGTGNIQGIFPTDDHRLLLVTEYSKLISLDINTGLSSQIIIPDVESANHLGVSRISNDGHWLFSAYYYNSGVSSIRYFESKDKGTIWSEIILDLQNEDKAVHIDYFPNGQLGIVSNTGNVYIYDSGGTILIGEIADVLPNITDHFLLDQDVWYAASYDQESNSSILHRSSDGGVTWSIDQSFNNGHITTTYFTNKNNGYLILNNKEIYKRTGPNNINDNKNIRITLSPNPVTDLLHISTNITDLSDHTIKIIDAQGRRVMESNGYLPQLNVARLPDGLYNYILIDHREKTSYSETFIKS